MRREAERLQDVLEAIGTLENWENLNSCAS